MCFARKRRVTPPCCCCSCLDRRPRPKPSPADARAVTSPIWKPRRNRITFRTGTGSPHERNSVGCEACHDGDSTTFERALVHREVLSSGNPGSPVNGANIPETCGSCHVGPYTKYQLSAKPALCASNDGDRRVPVCVTCHSDVGARLLSPIGLERTCTAVMVRTGSPLAQGGRPTPGCCLKMRPRCGNHWKRRVT